MNFKIPFASRAHNYMDNEIDSVIRVMRNAKILTQGDYLKDFESKFANYLSVEKVFALSNAASALDLVAQLCQFNDGDEIIIPAHTYIASAYPFIKHGAKIVWCDIDPFTRVISLETIKKIFTKKTKAILAVHLYGFCVDLKEILEFSKNNNIILIEDAAQAIGSSIDNKMAGTFGDFGVFSFHSHKNMSTLGEGGALYVKDKNLQEIIPMLRHNGHCDFSYSREHYWKPAMGNVDLPILNGRTLMPNNFCLSEVQCAVGINLIDRVDEINLKKRERAIHFIDSVGDSQLIKFHRVDSPRHNYHLLVAEVSSNNRDFFIEEMSKEGIQCVVQYYPLYRYDFFKKLGLSQADCPNTDAFFDNMISFPFHHKLSNEDFEYILNSAKKIIDKIGL